ncbi:hypothetical protein [Pantoea agglomerans]|uniref:hypothetical protein n=1 Tax=Enterobacter agglomerans TaxID=549 RepID=UPI0010C1B4E6|nr:hypothetical protein [Pantoea agglomerans]
MSKPEYVNVQLSAYDSILRALLETLPPEQFAAFSEKLSQLWEGIHIPQQAASIQPLLTEAMKASLTMVETAKLERSR